MKKTLLAAALLAGYAGAASAQSSVTLYGVVDLGFAYQSVKAGNNADAFANPGKTYNQLAMASGQQSGSRWGLKGVEDLGNGLKANFVYESGVTVNTGASSGFTRQSTIGLSSTKWGSVDLGRRTTSGTWAFSGIDPFAAGFGQAALDSSMGAQFSRLSNMIMYTSPSISGFGVSAGYSFDTGQTNYFGGTAGKFGTSNKYRAITTGVRYANGPLLLAAMYDQYMPPAVANKASASVKQWNLGATYDFKVAKLHAAYGQNIDGIIEGTNVLANAETSGGNGNSNGGILFAPGARTQSWMLGVSAPVGAGKVFGSVQQLLPSGNLSGYDTSTQTTASIGYTYNLSKRTNLYAYYSYMSNAALQDGASAQTLGVGVRHLF